MLFAVTLDAELRELRLDRLNFLPLAQAVLGAGGLLKFRASGFSMLPWIRDGDELIVGPVKPTEISRGDVLMFHTLHDRVLVHRVIGIKRRKSGDDLVFYLRGDNRRQPDGFFSGEQILGRVEQVRRTDGSGYYCTSRLVRLFVWVWLLPGVQVIARRWIGRRSRQC